MEEMIYVLLALSATPTSCSKWTEIEVMCNDSKKAVIEDPTNKRNAVKWVAEVGRTVENKKTFEVYWRQLCEYKEGAWLNTGKIGRQVSMVHFWFGGLA